MTGWCGEGSRGPLCLVRACACVCVRELGLVGPGGTAEGREGGRVGGIYKGEGLRTEADASRAPSTSFPRTYCFECRVSACK
jgi:hypothetical protein